MFKGSCGFGSRGLPMKWIRIRIDGFSCGFSCSHRNNHIYYIQYKHVVGVIDTHLFFFRWITTRGSGKELRSTEDWKMSSSNQLITSSSPPPPPPTYKCDSTSVTFSILCVFWASYCLRENKRNDGWCLRNVLSMPLKQWIIMHILPLTCPDYSFVIWFVKKCLDPEIDFWTVAHRPFQLRLDN